ncbi:MAG: sulfotransferase [Bacteroidota bacterium]|nr:sulfotransferase [Bacteroidota bacterium]
MAKKANFFIIGAAKGGTTSLFKYLEQHPDIYFSPIKEPNYFSDDILVEKFSSTYKKNNFLDTDSYFSKNKLEEIHLSFVRKKLQYERLFKNVKRETAIGECSTSYLFSKNAATNIFTYNPNAKIIAILRNPIDRAYSHYLMALRFGYTKLPFREAVEKDLNSTKKAWGISELFVELGQYHLQLKRYFDVFPKRNIQILFFEDLKTDEEKTIKSIFDFLELKNLNIDTSESFNARKVPKFKFLNEFLTKSGIKKMIQNIFSDKSLTKLDKYYFSNNDIPKINKKDKEFLLDIFRDDIQRTSELLGRELGGWMK